MRMKATLWGIVINVDVFNLSHIGKNVELNYHQCLTSKLR